MPRIRTFVFALLAAALAACAAPPQPPPAEAGPYLLFFQTDSAELTPEARTVAYKAAAAAAALKPSAIAVLGFASKEGPADANRELSDARVKTVERTLQEAGVDPALLRPLALGETRATRADVSERYVKILFVR